VKKEMPICPDCGTNKIIFDAISEWSIERQEFDLVTADTFLKYCYHCNKHIKHAKWVIIKTNANGEYI
jgi:hypothetical protein